MEKTAAEQIEERTERIAAAENGSSSSSASFCSLCGRRLGRAAGRGRKWAQRLKTWGGAISGLFSIFFYLFLLSLFLGGGFLSGADGKHTEVLYGSGKNKIAIVDIAGIILEDEGGDGLGFAGGNVTTARGLVKTFEQVRADKDVRAVVLRINSPGGSVTASEEIYRLVKRFKQTTQLPVIVSQGDTAASGGYYVSLAGDEIVADGTTLTGSIGAIIQTVNVQELAEKLGVKGVVIASGKNKDLLNPFEKVRKEQVALLRNLVGEAREQFVERILAERPIERGKLEWLADGRVLSGRQALENGLVDKLGDFNDAVELAKQRAGLAEATVVVFGKKGLLENLLGAAAARFTLTTRLPLAYLDYFRAQPAYLYLP